MSDKRYLGDGVYAETEEGMVKLTVENGLEATDTIWIDSTVWKNLQNFINGEKENGN